MLARVEVRKLVYTIEHIANQLLEKQPRCDPDLSAQRAGNSIGKRAHVRVVDQLPDALGLHGALDIQVAYLGAKRHQRFSSEAGQPDLHRPRVVEATVGGEVGMQPLSERRQPAEPGWTFEERRRPGDHQIETRKAPRINLVDQLPQRVEPLIADVATHSLQRFHLVEHHEETRDGRRHAARSTSPWSAAIAPK